MRALRSAQAENAEYRRQQEVEDQQAVLQNCVSEGVMQAFGMPPPTLAPTPAPVQQAPTMMPGAGSYSSGAASMLPFMSGFMQMTQGGNAQHRGAGAPGQQPAHDGRKHDKRRHRSRSRSKKNKKKSRKRRRSTSSSSSSSSSTSGSDSSPDRKQARCPEAMGLMFEQWRNFMMQRASGAPEREEEGSEKKDKKKEDKKDKKKDKKDKEKDKKDKEKDKKDKEKDKKEKKDKKGSRQEPAPAAAAPKGRMLVAPDLSSAPGEAETEAMKKVLLACSLDNDVSEFENVAALTAHVVSSMSVSQLDKVLEANGFTGSKPNTKEKKVNALIDHARGT
ncbi:unnamed protein product [Prorocentrum cordatum]|uniref:DEK C-terminal domain-containing protein n=1 Tax=Prorocentrum cordatum TaxID=2364126 RepID=A0ABN9WI10_9DINO|nr:unnamed protein product [Polarella glacialis]